MGILSQKIEDKITKLKLDHQTNTQINHQPTKGSLNENGLASLINDIIPSKYKITKGIIENSQNKQSNETDLIIYDDEVLPSYIKDELSFVPVEATKYIFEIKTTLNSNEIKTTIDKFSNFRNLNGISPTVLFSYSSDINGSEIQRLKKYESDFFINPQIKVFYIIDKCYYYKQTEIHYLKDFFDKTEWLKILTDALGFTDLEGQLEKAKESLQDNKVLNTLSRSEFLQTILHLITLNKQIQNIKEPKNVISNNLNFDEITFKVHKWIGITQINSVPDNHSFLCFLSGISNTLSKDNFGKYLINNNDVPATVYSVCFEDMWGNISCEDFDENGLGYDTTNFTFELLQKSKNNEHRMTFTVNKDIKTNSY